jgi:hypothetical protein
MAISYYLTPTGNGVSLDGTLPSGAVACTQEQYASAGAWTVSGETIVAAPSPLPTDTRLAARAALTKSDTTILRCYEHAVPVPADWAAYRATLRTIISGPATTAPLPVAPPRPAGT